MYRAHHGESFSGLASILPPFVDKRLASFTITKFVWLSNLADSIFSAVEMDEAVLKRTWTSPCALRSSRAFPWYGTYENISIFIR
jgi:hypothetical protein